jgi:DMSO reductase family type II enzyme heme b subunit
MAACLAACLLSGCGRSSAPSKSPPQPVTAAQPADPAEHGKQLFARHCAACHGEQGDGKGVAAAFLFPRPRDFRAGRFRLVSTKNNVPLREDLHAVLLRGMPGSAMPPWAQLSQAERDALVDEVIRLRQAGARDSYIVRLKDEEALSDEEIAAEDVQKEIQDFATKATTPGESSDVPSIPPSSAESIARGKEVYTRFACIQCHGATGRGDGTQAMVDDEKLPTRPRDFTLGVFKGNHDESSLYRRIAYGMPGTPMPSSTGMAPEQMIDLVHFIRSMSTEEQRQAAILKRNQIVVKRVVRVPNSVEANDWAVATSLSVRTTPLWWGAAARSDVDVAVQALHDGKTIAVRLTWPDETNDQHALRSESFEDAVAMELYHGESEPFLGMGDKTAPVDVWFWDADRQAGQSAVDAVNPNAVVDVYPFSEKVVIEADMNRTGATMADQPEISMPARAAGNQIVPSGNEPGGSALHVGGPGSVTFRIPQSQYVRAHGVWNEGRWTVVMSRQLSVDARDGGVELKPGARASAAFAIWNGAHRDRDGQKAITVWQDMELER